MRRINLFSDTTRFGKYKKYAYLTKIGMLILVSGSFILLLILVVLLMLQQSKFNQLTEQIPQELQTSTQDPDTLGKTVFAYNKLKSIEDIYYGSPEYYKQYKYLLNLISKSGSFTIDEFSLSSKNSVQLTLTSSKLTEVFVLINKFDDEAVKKFFSSLQVSTVRMKLDHDETGKSVNSFSVTFDIQFNSTFNETNT